MKFTSIRHEDFQGSTRAVATVRTRFTKREVQAIIQNGIRAVNSAGPDSYGFARVFWGAIAQSLFLSIHTAFLAKSNHGSDELGLSWVDLTPQYKTYGRMDARVGIPLPGPKYRPTLTPAQDKAWRGVFARIAFKLNRSLTSKKQRQSLSRKELDVLRGKKRRQGMDIAAASAWIFVKEHMDAHPLIELCPPRKVPLLVKTHRLVDSLEPAPLASDGSYHPLNQDQVFRVRGGELTLGTRVPYAEYLDPKRPLWPRDISIWMDRATEAGRDAIQERLAQVLAS